MRKGSFPFAREATRDASKVSVVSRRILGLRTLILIGLLENGRHNSGRQVRRDWMGNFWRRCIFLGAATPTWENRAQPEMQELIMPVILPVIGCQKRKSSEKDSLI